jgi:uncharacterized integral membrane protein
MRALSFLFLIALLAVLGVLAYENNRTATVSVGRWSWELPFPLLVAALYVLGMLTGWALLGAVKRSWRRVSEYERA